MVDYIFIPSEDIPRELHEIVSEVFKTHVQPKKYIYAFHYRGTVYSGALDRNSILGRNSILADLKDKPRTAVQELKVLLTVYQLDPNLKNYLTELKPCNYSLENNIC